MLVEYVYVGVGNSGDPDESVGHCVGTAPWPCVAEGLSPLERGGGVWLGIVLTEGTLGIGMTLLMLGVEAPGMGETGGTSNDCDRVSEGRFEDASSCWLTEDHPGEPLTLGGTMGGSTGTSEEGAVFDDTGKFGCPPDG